MSATNYPKLFNFEISKESDSHFSFLGYLYRLFSFFQRCASITPLHKQARNMVPLLLTSRWRCGPLKSTDDNKERDQGRHTGRGTQYVNKSEGICHAHARCPRSILQWHKVAEPAVLATFC